ncbi:uncharacterized protein LOC130828126 [Amaranthus tricolor]|uniref:uncharacterized protein LOC130828126 n=1 Tax=Amaranthus tricolor TaxID=29722 RepID=UPI002590AECD|nr:uncharacterized protein LOC130828126 [Amaranthus tricolor]
MASAIGSRFSTILNGFTFKLNSPCYLLPCFLAIPHPCTIPQTSPLSISSNSASSSSGLKQMNHLLRASSEGLQNDLVEDSKFVPLNAEDPSYGPPALLLLGFQVDEANKIQQLLKDLDGEFLQVIYCTEEMISWSLWDAMNVKKQNLEKLKIAESLPRLCFLSGLSGEEMMMFIDAFEETGLEPVVFAAHVPNSSSKPLQELIEEIMGDHKMMSANQSDSG